jgi:hypothetical protein
VERVLASPEVDDLMGCAAFDEKDRLARATILADPHKAVILVIERIATAIEHPDRLMREPELFGVGQPRDDGGRLAALFGDAITVPSPFDPPFFGTVG